MESCSHELLIGNAAALRRHVWRTLVAALAQLQCDDLARHFASILLASADHVGVQPASIVSFDFER